MTRSINRILPGVELDYDRDVLPLSKAPEGGGVTERHLMYALARGIVQRAGRGSAAIGFLEDAMGVALSPKQRAQLSDTGYPFYEYDLLGILKSSFLPAYI